MSQYMNDEKKLNEVGEETVATAGGTSAAASSGAWYAFFGDPKFLISATAVGGIVAAIKLIQSNTIKGRFQKCVKILYRMQKDFGTAEQGMNMKAVLPGAGSMFMDWISRLLTFKGKDKNKNRGALGLRPFVDNYINEIQEDYRSALVAYNSIIVANSEKSQGSTGVETDDNTSKVYDSFASAFSSEDKLNESASSVTLNEAFGWIGLGKNGNLKAQGQDGTFKEIAVNEKSTREVAYTILNLFFSKYFNMKNVSEKLGITSLEDIDEKNIDKFQAVAKKFAEVNSSSESVNNKMYVRVKKNYDNMVKGYIKIGSTVVKNFETFSKKKMTDSGKEMSEKDSNLLASSVEKLNAELNRQQDAYENNFNRVLLPIISCDAYKKFISFIINDVFDALKTGKVEGKEPVATEELLSKKGDIILGDEEKAEDGTLLRPIVKVTSEPTESSTKKTPETTKASSEPVDTAEDESVTGEVIGYVDSKAVSDNNGTADFSRVETTEVIPVESTTGEEDSKEQETSTEPIATNTGNEETGTDTNTGTGSEETETDTNTDTGSEDNGTAKASSKPKSKTIKIPKKTFLRSILSRSYRFISNIPKAILDKLTGGEEEKKEDEASDKGEKKPVSAVKVYKKVLHSENSGTTVEQFLLIALGRNKTQEERQEDLKTASNDKTPDVDELEAKTEEGHEDNESLQEADRTYANLARAQAKQREVEYRVEGILFVTYDEEKDIKRKMSIEFSSEVYYSTIDKELKEKGIIGEEGTNNAYTEVKEYDERQRIYDIVLGISKENTKKKTITSVDELAPLVVYYPPAVSVYNNYKAVAKYVVEEVKEDIMSYGKTGCFFTEISGAEGNTTELKSTLPAKMNLKNVKTGNTENVAFVEYQTGVRNMDGDSVVLVLIPRAEKIKEESTDVEASANNNQEQDIEAPSKDEAGTNLGGESLKEVETQPTPSTQQGQTPAQAQQAQQQGEPAPAQAQVQPKQPQQPQPKQPKPQPLTNKYKFTYEVAFGIRKIYDSNHAGTTVVNYESVSENGSTGAVLITDPNIKNLAANIVKAITALVQYGHENPSYLGESKVDIKYNDMFSLAESFMGTLSYLKVNRQITPEVTPKDQYYILSENVWGDGVIRNPEEYLKNFVDTANSCKTYSDFAALAKSSVSINFMPLSEDCSYKTRLPYNRFGMLTQSNPLYESTIAVSFYKDETVKHIVNLGISKIAK